jgi:hypothetical protein
VYGSRQTSYFFSHMSHSCSTHLTLKVFCLDIYLSQRLAITDIHIICVSRFSIVSFTFFSTASNSSSKSCISLTSPSFIIRWWPPPPCASLYFTSLPSAFSRSASRRVYERRSLALFSRMICSYFLFLVSASSACSCAASACV